MSCHVMSSCHHRFATVGCNDVQHLLSLTVCSRLSPDRPVHWQMLHIHCLPWFLTPSTRPNITLLSMLSCGSLTTCPKYRSLRDSMWFSSSFSVPMQWSQLTKQYRHEHWRYDNSNHSCSCDMIQQQHQFNGPLSELPGWASTNLDLLAQETVSCTGISWTICKSFTPHSRQITMPASHHSVFTGRMPFLSLNQQHQSTDMIWY